MDCERFDKNSMGLLFGELDELSEAAALRHLHHCTRCRGLWGHLKATKETARLPLEDPPAELFSSIIAAERVAERELSLRERSSRAISVLAEYAMRPQLAMAALLMLMVGSSMVFIRARPDPDHDAMRVIEQGSPRQRGDTSPLSDGAAAKVFAGDPTAETELAFEEQREDAESENESAADESLAGPQESYALALTAYQEGRYAEAERLFSEVALSGGNKSGPAALHEGHSARNGSGCQRAAPVYERVADSFSGTVADEAAWHAASCYQSMGQPERAAAHLRSLLKRPAYAKRAQELLEELGALDSAVATTASPEAEIVPAEASSGAVAAARAAPSAPRPASAPAPKKTPPSEGEEAKARGESSQELSDDSLREPAQGSTAPAGSRANATSP